MAITSITARNLARLFVPALVLGLAAVFALATYLSYFAARENRGAFAYQEAVVSAQRDADLLRFQMFDRVAPNRRPAMYGKLLANDLIRMEETAETGPERPPSFLLGTRAPDFDTLESELMTREALGRERFDATTARNATIRTVANLLFAFVALLFTLGQARLRRRLARGRTLVEGMQRAFLARRRSLPNVRAGSVLLSATAGSNVGGDVHDIFSFDGRYGMFLVADVSGKGLEAAVDTAFVKYSIRTLFSADTDPGRVLERFASVYARAAENAESFVVLFLGVVDTETGAVRYASAGHEPAFLKRGRTVTLLDPTGPVAGVFPTPHYETHALRLERGDMIALSTDGLTESRDRSGAMLGAENVATWLAEIDADGSAMADAIARRLRARSRHIEDDLAILTLEYAPGRTATVEEPVREPVSGLTLVSANA